MIHPRAGAHRCGGGYRVVWRHCCPSLALSSSFCYGGVIICWHCPMLLAPAIPYKQRLIGVGQVLVVPCQFWVLLCHNSWQVPTTQRHPSYVGAAVPPFSFVVCHLRCVDARFRGHHHIIKGPKQQMHHLGQCCTRGGSFVTMKSC